MTFDDQLKRAFDTLSDRLRAEIERQTAALVDELAASARADREKATDEARDAASRVANGALEAAVADAREQAHAAGVSAGRAEARQEGVLEGLEDGRRQGFDDGRRQGFDEGRREGFEHGRQEGLAEGRQQGMADGRRQAEEEQRHASAVAAVAATQAERPASSTGRRSEDLAAAVRVIGGARSLSEILNALLSGAAHESTRADVWLVRGDAVRRWCADGPGAEQPLEGTGPIADAIRSGAVAASDQQVAVPIIMAGQTVAVLSASGSESAPLDTGAIEILARYAARCLEAVTAFTAARAMSPRETAGEDTGASEEHTSARRYARLLVSEIKLYHEPAVVEGRRDRDLATRLGGEIARARALYEERVPLQVRQRADYFREELVRTLANGDATLLQLT